MDLRDGIGIRAVTTWLPHERSTAADALSEGLLSPDDLAKLGTRELPVSDLAPPEMAVLAARQTLGAAGADADGIDVLVHSWLYHQGHDFWSPPHHIADRLGARRAVPFGVQQMCNGGALALQTAAAWLLAGKGGEHALVTTADRFAEPAFRRWNGDYGVVYGDAATAVLLHREPRPDDALHLRALATAAAPDLETVHRGEDEFSPAPLTHTPYVDVRRTKKAFLAEHGPDRLTEATLRSVRSLVRRVLDAAGLAPGDPRLRYVALPRLGQAALDTAYRPALTDVAHADTLDLAPDTGHLGTGDGAANLATLAEGRLLDPGRYALVISGGGGFTWSALLVQAPPRPAGPAGSATADPTTTADTTRTQPMHEHTGHGRQEGRRG
ncbi:ketoacyl-ACP synthase III family protein [Streptomyces sp. NPDC047028]|uniref:ketoacyl-ACP synthase III family protein n=1 Tax=Streptomyces sp. NPDC047028 TaxID=3155793 RepID=UPI0033E39777